MAQLPLSKCKTITLAIEHSERELDSKVFLAHSLVKSGWRVIIGSTESIDIFLDSADQTVVFHKSAFDKRSGHYKRKGHFFCFLDEEGGPSTPKEQFADFCRHRYKTISRDKQDIIFFPSQKYIDEVKKFADYEKIELVPAGWLRSDLWRQDYSYFYHNEVEELQRLHGKFYLFASSFGALSRQQWTNIIANDPSEISRRIQEYRWSRVEDYIDLLTELRSKLRFDEKLVIRPHPSEEVHSWKELIAEDRQIQIIREGDITPWVIAANGVLNFGSTAAFQSVFMGKRSVQYRVESIREITDSPSFELVQNVESADAVLSVLRGQKNQAEEKIQEKILLEEIGFDPSTPAAVKIVNKLNELRVRETKLTSISIRGRILINFIYFGSMIRMKVNRLLKFDREQTIAEKIPGGLRIEAVRDRLQRLDVGEPSGLVWDCRSISKNLIVVSPVGKQSEKSVG